MVAPSLLAADFSRLEEQIREVEQSEIKWLHLDVMDGHFVPNISFGPPVIASLRAKTRLTFDTHLMIEQPDRYLEAFREAGADVITVHQEVCRHLHRTVTRIRELGAKAGVALNPATPVSTLRDVLDSVDLILIMTVNPGFGGQAFIKGSAQKVREARALVRDAGRSILIEVDGGIDASTAAEVVDAGANVLVAGTSVFRKGNIGKAISEISRSYSLKA